VAVPSIRRGAVPGGPGTDGEGLSGGVGTLGLDRHATAGAVPSRELRLDPQADVGGPRRRTDDPHARPPHRRGRLGDGAFLRPAGTGGVGFLGLPRPAGAHAHWRDMAGAVVAGVGAPCAQGQAPVRPNPVLGRPGSDPGPRRRGPHPAGRCGDHRRGSRQDRGPPAGVDRAGTPHRGRSRPGGGGHRGSRGAARLVRAGDHAADAALRGGPARAVPGSRDLLPEGAGPDPAPGGIRPARVGARGRGHRGPAGGPGRAVPGG
jgi:hypothetical protein